MCPSRLLAISGLTAVLCAAMACSHAQPYPRKTIRIVSTRSISATSLAPYFDSVTISERELDGAKFWIADGHGFRFEPYYEQVLKKVAATYYRMPAILPLYGCRFLEQYGFERVNR